METKNQSKRKKNRHNHRLRKGENKKKDVLEEEEGK